MDIAALSMANSTNQLLSAVGVSMLSNSIDQTQQEGAAIAGMIASAGEMELSVNPNVGANFDMSI